MRTRLQGSNPGLRCAIGAVLLFGSLCSHAYTINISAGTPRTVYLQVGVGSFTGGTFKAGGSPAVNGTINLVSVTVPVAQIGNGAAQVMTTDSTASNSFLDNRPFCSLPGQLYVGGYYRASNASVGSPAATLVANVPASLTSSGGQAIPFSQIRWTSSGIGDAGTQPFPSGIFPAGGSLTIGSIRRNQWAESCHAFSYINTGVPPAGVYTGRVTYTLSLP